jgi:hypothetical protein
VKNIYISSTYGDLKEYRKAVADVLRDCGYNVDAMEKYGARDDRPKAACEVDVSNGDLYIGIFAWRYGYVPVDDNPEGKSITELEYLAAGLAKKPRLVFLLADDAPWSSALRDAEIEEDEGKRIRDLRRQLKAERWTGFFKSPDDLAKQVLKSVLQFESTKRTESLKGIDEIGAGAELGPSFLPNIAEQIEKQASAEFVVLRLGPTPWWNTRLHLVAALASDFTEIGQFVLLDGEGRFLTMAPPVEIRRALAKAVAKLEMVYLKSRELPPQLPEKSEVDNILFNYRPAVNTIYDHREEERVEEERVKEVMTPGRIRELGIKSQAEVLEEFGSERHPLSIPDLMRRHAPYIVLMRDGKLEGVIDRLELASRIVSTTLP